MTPELPQPDSRTDSAQNAILRLNVHADAGAQPASSSAELVEQVLQDCDAVPGTPVSVAVPAGDATMVARLHDLLDEDEARRAGATVIVDGVLPGGG
jgi:hypothetical protein